MRLSEKAIDAIKNSGELYGKIADNIGVRPLTMPDKIRKHKKGEDSDLTKAGVINLIKQYTPLNEDEIFEEQPATIN
jgi:hypothetical protein